MKQFDLEKYKNFIVIAEDGEQILASLNVTDITQLALAIGATMLKDERFAELIIGVADAYVTMERRSNLDDFKNSKN